MPSSQVLGQRRNEPGGGLVPEARRQDCRVPLRCLLLIIMLVSHCLLPVLLQTRATRAPQPGVVAPRTADPLIPPGSEDGTIETTRPLVSRPR